MNSGRDLPLPKWVHSLPNAELFRSLAGFIFVGAMSGVVHASVGLGLVWAGVVEPFVANIFAFLSAFSVSYTGHRTFTFKSKSSHSKAMSRFFVIASFGLILNQVIVYVMVNMMGIAYYISLLVVFSLVSVATYILGRFWAFPAAKTDITDTGTLT